MLNRQPMFNCRHQNMGWPVGIFPCAPSNAGYYELEEHGQAVLPQEYFSVKDASYLLYPGNL